ncbi:MAG: HK97 family phage prohead protease [Pseudomonadota bacterium]
MKANVIRFAGYAGLFNLPDADRDTIRKGAFADSLRARAEPLPILWQHRPEQRIGEVERIAEDTRGLRVIGRISSMQSQAAKLLNDGAVSGLSFGYRARQSRQSPSGRELLDIELFEISVVTHPLQHRARIHLIA